MGNASRSKPVLWRGRLTRATQNGVVYPDANVADVRGYGYTRTGSNNPSYKRIICQGGNATGAMNVIVLNAETQDVTGVLSRRGSSDPQNPEYWHIYESTMTGVHLSLNLPVPVSAHYQGVSFDNACAMARRVVHKRLTGRRRQFQGAVAAWELGKTLSMVVKPAKALRSKVASATKRVGKLMKASRRSGASRQSLSKVLADTWLELAFGWQPLLADTRDGALALARLASKDALERQQFRAYGAEETPLPSTIANNYQVGYDALSIQVYNRAWHYKTMAECIIYGKFVTRLQDSSYAKASSLRLAELCGFNFADFLPSAWEAVPWSFLVDYFANVGDVIEAFSNNVGEIGWAAEVHIQTSEEKSAHVLDQKATASVNGALFYGLSGNDCTGKSSRKTVTRSSGGVDFSTYLRFNLPGGIQWLNIGALAVGARPPKPFY